MAKEAKQTEEKNADTPYQDLENSSAPEQAEDEAQSQGKPERMAKLEKKLEEKEELIQDLEERIRHLQADFENYKKRQTDKTEERIEKEKGELIKDLVPIYDNLDRAFKSFESNEDEESFIEGVEKIYAQFDDFLSKRDVQLIEAEGEQFDPSKHEALMRIDSDDYEHNQITEEFERGYLYKGKVLKPSKVKVNINPSQGNEGDNDNDSEHKQGR